ncbi:TetR family transcriptional regulator [Rubrobacter marinus]|uniref:TetR family transcriptional regulator n=1 Tax=Rubrobacter marinus TaxID=2653852 RepID=UPI001A9D0A8A|nr:TetR family transcriptional regulator [Rubrobacter marinus]
MGAGVELARGGADAVVQREATRRVGMAPSAAYRHFADRRELLDAVCPAIQAKQAVAMKEGLAWSAVHGPAMLLIDGTLRGKDGAGVYDVGQRLIYMAERGL